MLCESCQEREATIMFTTVAGDDKKTLQLCPECARRESEKHGAAGGPEASPQKVVPANVSSSKKVSVVVGHLAGTEAPKDACPNCGLTYDQFRKAGRLGCAQCYQAFGAPLRRLLKRIHGAETHVGRGPEAAAGDEPGSAAATAPSVEQLRQALQAAVAAEEYERAAELRDRITRQQKGAAG